MLKNEKLIYKMSVEQKIQFLLSSKPLSNDSVGSYEFPTFKMDNNPLNDNPEVYATFFPSDKALASSFNLGLVSLVYNLKGVEANALLDTPFYNVTNNLQQEDISSNYYLTANFLNFKVKGLNASNAIVNYEEVVTQDAESFNEQQKFLEEVILKGAYFKSVLLENEDSIYRYRLYNKNNELTFSHAKSKEEVLQLLTVGCCLIYVDEEILNESIDYISECVYRYKDITQQLENNKITKNQFNKYCEENITVNEQLLDNAVDAFMNVLVDLVNRQRSISEKFTVVENGTHAPLYNEVMHNKKAKQAANESIILLKNNRALPIKYKTKVAIMGEYAKSVDFVLADFANKATTSPLAFDIVNEFDIVTTGFAYGYKQGEVDNEQTIKAALTLANESDCSVVFLYAKQGEEKLPEEQLQLIDALYEAKKKIIAVVVANNSIDITFEEKCEAVLFTYNAGQQTANAVYSVLVGLENPSAKLIDDLYVTRQIVQQQNDETVEPEIIEEKEIKYPFGQGLSYSTFEYYNLSVSDSGVVLTITNTSEEDGYAIPQLYVLKENSTSYLQTQTLKGFTKVFLKANESIKVEIPFDGNTFKTYDERLNKYCIEGGEYKILIGDSYQDIRLKGTVILSRYVYNDDGFQNEVLEDSNDFEALMKSFSATNSKQEYIKEGKGGPFGLKLTLTILLAVYFNAMIAVFFIGNLTSSNNVFFTIVLVLLFILVNLFATLYIVKIAKKRIRFIRLTLNNSLSKVVENVSSFKEIEKTVYKEPIVEEVEETPVEEDVELTAQEAVNKQKKYQETFEEEESVLFKAGITLPELCNNFHDFALSKGVEVEYPSVRSLFAAMASSKIIFLDIKNKNLLPSFLEILNEFFSSNGVFEVNESIVDQSNLFWKEENENYVASEFIKSVRAAANDKKRTSITILNNVTMENFYEYFDAFIEYALHPSEVREIKLNDELSLTLPNNINYFVVPSEDTYLEKFSRDLAKAAVCIDVVIAKSEEEYQEVEIKSVSYPDLLDLIREAKENHYLPENIWKRLDELIETINLTEKFGFGNKSTLQIERFSSTLVECGGDESEAFALAFASKIVPLLKTLKTYKKENGDRTLFGIIEKIFAEEDLTKIQKVLLKKVD